MILQNIALFLMCAGTAFLLLGSIGIVRFPDFYSRMHAMSKPDTMGLVLTLTGLALYHGWDLVSLKLILGVFFIAIANAAATHVLGRAALKNGLKPWTRKEKKL